MSFRQNSIIAALACTFLMVAARAAVAGTTFTYQGRLTESGVPANGAYHLRFQLWSALTGGAQIGANVDAPGTAIADGYFSVPLDFGISAFNGADRWLQVQVVTNGGATVTPLVPRQPITATPYALQTRGIVVNDMGMVGIGLTSPATTLHVNGAENNGTTAGLRIDSAAQSMLLDGNEIDTNTAVGLYLNNNNANDVILVNGGGDVGIGVTVPQARLDVVSSGSGTGIRSVIVDPGGGSGSAVYAEILNSGDASWYAGRFINRQNLASGALNFGVYAEATGGSGVGVWGENESTNGRGIRGYAPGAGGVGVESWGGAYNFLAAGPGIDYGSQSSIRWKRNLEPIDAPLDMIARLRGLYFDWDDEHGGRRDIGMIAEEVGAVLPEIVAFDPNGVDADGMDYSKLTPLLVEAVKALRAENAALAERLMLVERELADLAGVRPATSP